MKSEKGKITKTERTKKAKLIMKLGILATAVIAFEISAQAKGIGSTSGDFLKLETSARAVSLGSAYGALAIGSEALFVNPAGLAGSNSKLSLNLAHSELYEGLLQHEVMGVSIKLGDKSAFGIGATVLRQEPLAAFDSRGNPLGTIDLSDEMLMLGWAHELLPSFTGGLNFKLIQSNIASYKAKAYAMDVGLKTRISEKFNFGLSLQNFWATDLKYRETAEKLPSVAKISSALGLGLPLILSFEASRYLQEEVTRAGVGVEYSVVPMSAVAMSLRLGFLPQLQSARKNSDSMNGLRAGFGLTLNKTTTLDYAFVPQAALGATHRVTLNLALGSNR